MIRTLLIAAVLSSAAGAASAEPWSQLVTDGTMTLSFDQGSIETSAGHVKFWDRLVLSAPQTAADFQGEFTEVRFQRDMDCANKTVATLAQRFLDAKGAVVHTIDTPEAAAPINPGSPADKERAQVCK